MKERTRFSSYIHFDEYPDSWIVELYRQPMGTLVLHLGDINVFLTNDQAREVSFAIDEFLTKEAEAHEVR